MHNLIAMRGLPGSGKTRLARELTESTPGSLILSADDLFTAADGTYQFDPARIGEAHGQCFRAVCRALSDGAALIVVDNTNLTCWELSPYALAASAFGYAFEIHEVAADAADCAARNVHGVSREAIERMVTGTEAPLPRWTHHLHR